jgi:hypothetical protein
MAWFLEIIDPIQATSTNGQYLLAFDPPDGFIQC